MWRLEVVAWQVFVCSVEDPHQVRQHHVCSGKCSAAYAAQARLMLVHSPFNLEFRDPALFSMYHMHDIHPSVLKSNRHTPCGSMATAWECTRNPLVIIPQSYLLRSYHWIHRDYLNLWFYLFLLPEIANWWVNGLHPNTSSSKGEGQIPFPSRLGA